LKLEASSHLRNSVGYRIRKLWWWWWWPPPWSESIHCHVGWFVPAKPVVAVSNYLKCGSYLTEDTHAFITESNTLMFWENNHCFLLRRIRNFCGKVADLWNAQRAV
jgi:hypothetical protein